MAGNRLIRGARICRTEGDKNRFRTDHLFLPILRVKIKFHSFEDQESELN